MQQPTIFDIDGIPHRLFETLSDGNCMISCIRFLCGETWTTSACRRHRRVLAARIEEDEFGEEVVETASLLLQLNKDTSATILRTCGRVEDPGTERHVDQLMDAELTTEECIFIAADMEVDICIYRTRNGELESIFCSAPCTDSGGAWPQIRIWYNGSNHYKALLPVNQEDIANRLDQPGRSSDPEHPHSGTPIAHVFSTPSSESDTDGNQTQDLGLPAQSRIGELVPPTELELRHYLLRNNYRLRIGTDMYIVEATTFDGNSMVNCILLALGRPYGTGPADALRKRSNKMVQEGTLGVKLKDKLQKSAFRSFDFSRGMHNFDFKTDVETDLLRSMPNLSSMSTYLEAPNLLIFSELLSCRIRVITAKHREVDANGFVNIIFRVPQDMSADGDYESEVFLLYDGSEVAGHYWLLRRQDEQAEDEEGQSTVYPGLQVIRPRTAQPSHLVAPVKVDKNYQQILASLLYAEQEATRNVRDRPKKFDGKLRRVVGSKMEYFVQKKQQPRTSKKGPAPPSARLRKGARAHETSKDKNNLEKLNENHRRGATKQVKKRVKFPVEREEDDLGKVSKPQKETNRQRRKAGQREFEDTVLKLVVPKKKSTKSRGRQSKKAVEEELLDHEMSEEDTSTSSDDDKKEWEKRGSSGSST